MTTSTPHDRDAAATRAGEPVDATRQTPAYDERAGHTGHTVHTEHVEPVDRRSVVARQREEHGGVKVGSAFFGFLTAIGVGVLLTGLLTAAGAAVGLATNTDTGEAADLGSANADTVGLVGGIALLVVVFLSYYAGGYVAGRMARFDGMKQGVAVWVWALVVAIVIAVLGVVAGNQYDVLGQVNAFPRLPVNEGDLTQGGIIAAAVLALTSLIGAMVGGLAGMHFHRKVDKTGLPG